MKGIKMKTKEQMILTRLVEGAVAAAILKEWRQLNEDFVIPFPGISVFPLEEVPAPRKLHEHAPAVQDGYSVIFACPIHDIKLSGRFSEGEAQTLAKNFKDDAEPDRDLRVMVREMLDTMNQDVLEEAQ